jgi:hypothetical protein
MGYPSIRVAALVGVPGIFSKIADTEPPVNPTEATATIKGRASSGRMTKVNGKKRVMANIPPTPGIIPKTSPVITPIPIEARSGMLPKF